MNKDYYYSYFKLEREHWWFVVRYEIIADQIKKVFGDRKDLKILNVGAATGRSTEILSQFGTVSSIEYDEDCVQFTNEKTNLDLVVGDITHLQFTDNQFDLVCAFDVIEHVENDQKALSELYRVTSKKGIVFITVPAFMTLWSHHDVINKHFRRYTMSNLEKLYEPIKYKTIRKTYFNSLLFIPIFLFRMFTKLIPASWLRKGAGSDNEIFDNDSFVNKVLLKIFGFERKLLKAMKFPFGVSIMHISRKL